MRKVTQLLLWPFAAPAQAAKPDESSPIVGHLLNAVTCEPVGKASPLLTRNLSTGCAYRLT